MKKILFVYPHNFLEHTMGTNTRIRALARELCRMGYTIDLYALSNFVSRYDGFAALNKEESLVNKLYLYDYAEVRRYSKRKRRLNRLLGRHRQETLDNWVTPGMVKQFNEIVSAGDYTHIVMFYAYTADLLLPENYRGHEGVCKIYFMEDLLSVGAYVSGQSSAIGSLLDDEMKRISVFDRIACISYDEKIWIEKLMKGRHHVDFLPHIVERKVVETSEPDTLKHPRVVFVGYDNPYNIEGMKWFLQEVYPSLSPEVELTVVGKVNRHLHVEYPNLHQIDYVPDLDEMYRHTDIIICPLLNGTGMKIKVVEAMSYGIPVVCTSRGVDGLPDKTRNGCLVADDAAAFAGHINRLVCDTAFYKQCQQQVKDYFSTTLDWSRHKDTLLHLFREE